MQCQVAAGGPGGSVINTASFVATLGAATSQISYTASKGGVLAMSRELGVQFAREGIRVNALSPGPVNTPLLRELFATDPERAARRLVHVPMGRFAEADEIAAAVAFLASDDASFITAVQLPRGRRDLRRVRDAAMRSRTLTPHVGISAYGEPARWGPWDRPAALLPMSYPEAVAAAGGVPVLLPPLPGIEQAVSRLDALVLCGGGDIDPAAYGAVPHPRTERVYPGRDRAERALLATALAAGIPVLAICRGLQIVNVSRGGTLRQHLPDDVGHHDHGSAARSVRRTSGADRGGQSARQDPRPAGAGRRGARHRPHLPPSGHRPARPGAGRDSLGGRRHDRSGRAGPRGQRTGPGSSSRCNGTRGRRRPEAVPGADQCGLQPGGGPGLTAMLAGETNPRASAPGPPASAPRAPGPGPPGASPTRGTRLRTPAREPASGKPGRPSL